MLHRDAMLLLSPAGTCHPPQTWKLKADSTKDSLHLSRISSVTVPHAMSTWGSALHPSSESEGDQVPGRMREEELGGLQGDFHHLPEDTLSSDGISA